MLVAWVVREVAGGQELFADHVAMITKGEYLGFLMFMVYS